MSDYRNIGAVVLALSLMQVAGGALAIVVPLALDLRGQGPFAIGVVTAFYGAGLMGGALTAPRFIASVGHIRAFAFFAAVAAALTLALYAHISAMSWAVVRLGLGACVAGIFTAGESWIATEAPKPRRGALLGFYHVLTKIALIAGALAVGGMAADSAAPFMIAGAVFALCLAPVAATRRAAPPPPSRERIALQALVRMAPAAFVAAAVAGLVNGAVTGLSPVYAAPSMPDDPTTAAAVFYAAIMIGGVVSQFPAGTLSDRVDRRIVVGALAAVASLASFALAFTPPEARLLQLGLALVWGAGALSFYGVAVAHAVDRVPTELHAPAMAGLLVVWAAGTVTGPLIAGAVMQSGLGATGLFLYAGVGLFVLTAAMIRRSYAREAVPAESREPFATVQASSILAAELDPRVEPVAGQGTEAAPPSDVERTDAPATNEPVPPV
jgi:MFS family permease